MDLLIVVVVGLISSFFWLWLVRFATVKFFGYTRKSKIAFSIIAVVFTAIMLANAQAENIPFFQAALRVAILVGAAVFWLVKPPPVTFRAERYDDD